MKTQDSKSNYKKLKNQKKIINKNLSQLNNNAMKNLLN